MKKLVMTVFMIIASCIGAMAQVAQPTLTTLSSAITTSQTTITVASATGFLPGDILIIDHEAILIPQNYVAATAIITNTTRGYSGTYNTGHVSGAYVMRFLAANVQLNDRTGSCTRANQIVLPVVSINRALRDVVMYDCNNGAWLKVTLPNDLPQIPLISACNIPIGSVAYASVGTNSTDVADKMMRTTIWVPNTVVVTGVKVLAGGTATTDKITAAIFDSGGRLVANTAAAGVLLSGANTFQTLPFTAVKIIPGPARYWIGVTGNGATAGAYQTVPTATFNNILSGSATSQTFGTFPEFTPATSFTADLAPVSCLYN